MNENHVQNTNTPTLIPPGGKPLTPETAVAAIKKIPMKDVLTRVNEEIPLTRARNNKLKIPYKAGTKDYQRAFYWCRKLGKTFPEFKENFEAGKMALKMAPKRGQEIPEKIIKTTTVSVEQPQGLSPIPVSESMWAKLGVTSDQQELIKILKEISDSTREAAATLKSMNANLGLVDKDINAMNNNILSLRTEMGGLKDNLKRSLKVKHQ